MHACAKRVMTYYSCSENKKTKFRIYVVSVSGSSGFARAAREGRGETGTRKPGIRPLGRTEKEEELNARACLCSSIFYLCYLTV